MYMWFSNFFENALVSRVKRETLPIPACHDMGGHILQPRILPSMKTTLEISDALLRTARRIATREGTTLRALVEQGLRRIIVEKERKPVFRLRKASLKGADCDRS